MDKLNRPNIPLNEITPEAFPNVMVCPLPSLKNSIGVSEFAADDGWTAAACGWMPVPALGAGAEACVGIWTSGIDAGGGSADRLGGACDCARPER
jgi:hypothetical protein